MKLKSSFSPLNFGIVAINASVAVFISLKDELFCILEPCDTCLDASLCSSSIFHHCWLPRLSVPAPDFCKDNLDLLQIRHSIF
uniref:Secreted protein n=1 Tax=Caenorhabditis tropicalis TaxID=1561998 RepID=A0A1I7TTS6_9PELO